MKIYFIELAVILSIVAGSASEWGVVCRNRMCNHLRSRTLGRDQMDSARTDVAAACVCFGEEGEEQMSESPGRMSLTDNAFEASRNMEMGSVWRSRVFLPRYSPLSPT